MCILCYEEKPEDIIDIAMLITLFHIAIAQNCQQKKRGSYPPDIRRGRPPPFDFLIPCFQFSDNASISSTMLPI